MKIDVKEVLVRLMKYFIEGLIVSICAFALPGKKISVNEVVSLGLIAAATFSILDFFSPSIAMASRQGAGFGIGSSVVGVLHMVN
jgi:uncharacterized RDD family membrane protein YckC